MQTYQEKVEAAVAAAMNQLGLSPETNSDTADCIRHEIDRVARNVVTGDETYRIVTVEFAIPHDDPAHTIKGFQEALQDMYDTTGLAGAFNIIKRTGERDGDAGCAFHSATGVVEEVE